MPNVYLLVHLLTDEERAARPGDGEMVNCGVFSTPELAAAACRSDRDAVVTFELDRDCTEERTFEVRVPALGMGPELITA